MVEIKKDDALDELKKPVRDKDLDDECDVDDDDVGDEGGIQKMQVSSIPNVDHWDTPHFNECWGNLMELYEGKDGYEWENLTTHMEVIQFGCFPEDRPVILMKAYSVVKAPAKIAVDCSIDFQARQFWDKTLYDFKVFDANADKSVSRISYTFRSPVPGVSDRDFYLQQLVRFDYPDKGSIAMHVSSLPESEEYPEQPGKVRAKAYTIGFIMRPTVDPKTGEEHT